MPAAQVRAALAASREGGRIHVLRRSPERYLSEQALAALVEKAQREITLYLESGSGAVGMPRRTLLSRLLPAADPPWAEAVEAALVERGAFAAVGDEARAPGRDDLVGRERELSERIADVFRERGLSPPSPAEVTQVVQHRQKVIEGLIGYLVKRGAIVRLPGGWLIALATPNAGGPVYRLFQDLPMLDAPICRGSSSEPPTPRQPRGRRSSARP